MEDDKVTLTRAELREVMSEAITDAFTRMGLDAEDPIQTQADMLHLRKWRLAVDSAQTTTFRTVVGLLATGFIAVLLLGTKAFFGQAQ